MYLIVGLGNPDKKHSKNFHNVGFMTLLNLAERLGIKIKKKDCNALCAEYFIDSDKIIFALPQTYMNLSGISVKKIMDKYKISLDKILIVYDDIDIALGELRFKEKGSAGTHNGMKSIVQNVGENFARLRVGIGKPEHPSFDLADYVLSDIPKKYADIFDDTFDRAADAVMDFINGLSFSEIMQKYN